jgi:hypothetical protein
MACEIIEGERCKGSYITSEWIPYQNERFRTHTITSVLWQSWALGKLVKGMTAAIMGCMWKKQG